MSDSDSAKTGGTTSGSQRTTNAILGIFVLLAIVVLANYVFNRVSHRFDLTENNIYTLTEGTKEVLEKVEKIGNPVLIRFYAVTDPDYVSQFYLTRAAAVEDFLREYEQRGGGLVEVKRYNPEPYSDAAEAAKFDGLPRGGFDDPDNPVYFGLVVESEGRTELLPLLPARPEEMPDPPSGEVEEGDEPELLADQLDPVLEAGVHPQVAEDAPLEDPAQGLLGQARLHDEAQHAVAAGHQAAAVAVLAHRHVGAIAEIHPAAAGGALQGSDRLAHAYSPARTTRRSRANSPPHRTMVRRIPTVAEGLKSPSMIKPA